MPESVSTCPANWRRGFWSLIVTQFQGAFNDYGLRNLVIFLILAHGFEQTRSADPSVRDQFVLYVQALFAIPFILFSMTGGYFADRFSKRSVTIRLKMFELGVMLVAVAGLATMNLYLVLAAIFLVSTQAALFGPSKYGLLPELLPGEKLSWGNGVIELGTFLALICGSVAGAFLVKIYSGRMGHAALLLLGFTVVGLATSFGISRVPPADVSRKFRFNLFGDLWSQTKIIRGDRVLWLAVVGNTYFWFLGALLQVNVILYGNDVLKVDETHAAYLQAAIAIGIGVGSLAAGYLSGGKIEYGLIPLGAIGMTVFGALLAPHGLSFTAVLIFLSLLGFTAGFFIVPVNALIQHRPDEQHKGAVIAAANLFSFVGVGAEAGVYYVLTHLLHLGSAAVFFWASMGTLATTIYVVWLLPDSLLRLLLWFATHTIYRMDISGREHVPARGGALLVPNHASIVDAALVIAATDRPVRFLMFKDIYEHPLIKPFAKILGVIPISGQQRPREMIHSLREATRALGEGELVCIFPEGQMTRIGQMMPFRRGMERILKGLEVPVIPMHIDGIWGSIFSFAGGKFFWKRPRRIPYPVRVTFGAAMPATVTSAEARQAVLELGADAFARRKREMKTIPESFIQTARRHPLRFAMADFRTPKLKFFSALVKTIFLARRLRPIWRDQEKVGILLPPSIGGALVNLAAMVAGKVPVNLNYTASNTVVEACAEQSGLKTTVTSRAFLEKIKVHPPGTPVYLEDLAEKPRFGEKIISTLAALFFPVGAIGRLAGSKTGTTLDDLATIIFSSGSTGDPKGVLLTHYNVAANVDQLNQVFMLHKDDRILGILPFFHSFGFTATLCLTSAVGIGVVYHPSPLDSRTIGALVSKYRVTLLLATPTFLQAYTRRCAPEDFGSLRYVIAGAEKLPARVSEAFEDHFGIRPLEGYGCTECSPVVAVNTMDFRAAAFRQVGAKRGSIGHPLPGIVLRTVDPETQTVQPVNQPGLLLVRGPNVMQGYLNHPEKTANVLKDGWYNTGDIATIDEDGFVRITDRLSRFSKIGGEMVPHIKIEDKLQEIAGSPEQVFVVTAVPDERKGERLIVLYTLAEEALKEVLVRFAETDLPALWKPRSDQFHRIEAMPYLGTGKLDLRRVRELGSELAQG
jgi:acyl-[acyl-carrier-protein]-phospholipid O-acyltransferase/long-chain-fatty-acid--[acyl-carrier-protein] ligase